MATISTSIDAAIIADSADEFAIIRAYLDDRGITVENLDPEHGFVSRTDDTTAWTVTLVGITTEQTRTDWT